MTLDKSGKIKLFQQATGWSTDKIRANAKVVNAICEGGAANAITYDEQDLTEEQKAQARTNIGAGTYSKPNGGIPSSDLADKNKLDLIGTEVVNSVTDIRSGGGDLVGYKITETYINSLGRIVTREINLSDLYTRNGVTYVLQSLTDQQKAQARSNIGIQSMTAQEVATAVDTAWTNIMGT